MAQTNILTVLESFATSKPDEVLYSFFEQGDTLSCTLTYGQLEQRSKKIASRLQSQVSQGTRAVLIYPPGLDFMVAFLGCLYAGVIAIPAPSLETFGQSRIIARLEAIIEDAQPDVILTTEKLQPQLAKLSSDTGQIGTSQVLGTDNLDDSWDTEWVRQEKIGDDIAYLQYTSGSTSKPKGVVITHENLISNLAHTTKALNYNSDSIIANWMPHFHDAGLVAGLLQSLYLGIPCYTIPPLALMIRPISWLEIISRYRVTHCSGTNSICDYCVTHTTNEQRQGLDLSSWQFLGIGAEPVRQATLEKFAQAFAPYGFNRNALSPGYGLAEATLTVTVTRKDDTPKFTTVDKTAFGKNIIIEVAENSPEVDSSITVAGCGQPIPHAKVVIVNPKTSLAMSGDEIGEIWVQSPCVSVGYWQRTDATTETFQAYLADTKEGPFLRTGDLGFLKEGQLFVTGRLKDLIIIRGKNYYPQDIEFTVEKSHTKIRDNCSATFAIEIDGVEKIVVVAEVDPPYVDNSHTEEIIAAIRNAIASDHELPIYAIALLKRGTIAKTSSGKIQRHATRKAFINEDLNAIAIWHQKLVTTKPIIKPRNEYEHFLLHQVWRKILEKKDISIDDNFFELGGDSLLAAKMITKIEAIFGHKIPFSAIAEAPTIEKLAKYLEKPDYHSSSKVLVAIKPQGSKRPFFYVHPRSGTVMLTGNLALYIDSERPFYGIQSVGLDEKQEPMTRIEDMAAYYIKEIQTIQPQGPYLIGGRCLGGKIAFEMAQQLLLQNQQVLLLAMVDSRLSVRRQSQITQRIETNIKKIEESNLAQANIFKIVMEANDLALAQYDFSTKVYPGSVAYFCGKDDLYDPSFQFGWSSLVTGKLDIHEVCGSHITLDSKQNIQVLAEKLNNCLNQAELSQENLDNHLIQGYVQHQQGSLPEAITSYQQALSLEPDNPQLYLIMGKAQKQQGDFEGAINSYRKAIELEPKNYFHCQNLAKIHEEQGEIEAAITAYSQAIHLDYAPLHLHNCLASAQERNGDLASAIATYQKILALSPESFFVHLRLGEIQLKQGVLEQAVQSYKKALEFNPSSTAAYKGLGKVQIKSGNYQGAIASYQQAIELDPKQPFAIYKKMGDALAQEGKIEDAITAYKKTIELFPERVLAYSSLGNVQFTSGNYQGAISSYQKAIELDSEQSFSVYSRLGDALITEGEIEKAISCYDKALQLQPNNKSIRKKLENLQNISHENLKLKANVINKNSGNTISRKIPKNLIFFWDNKQSAPEKVSQTIAKNIELNPDYNIIYADDEYMYEFIQSRYNQEILDLYRLNKIPASRSDIARLMLLYEYGGIYLDATMEVNKSLNNIIGNEEEIVLVRADDFPIYTDFPEKAEFLNGFIGAIPRCEFIGEIISKVIYNLRYGKYNNLVGFATGPYNFYALWHRYEGTCQISSLSCSQLKESFLIDHQIPNISHSWFDQQKQGVIDKSYYSKNKKFWEYEKISLHDKQIAAYHEILQSQPNDYYARIRSCQLNCKLGRSQKNNNNLELAIASYKKATELAPEYLLAHSFLGNAQFKCGNYQEAIFSYKKVIELDYRQSFSVYKRLGDALRKLEKIDKAIVIYQQAIKLFPEKPYPHVVLGHIQFESKNYPETITFYQKAINLNPEQPFIVYQRLGKALRKLQETDEAISAYNEALKLRPDSQIVHRSLTKLKLEIQNNTTKFIDVAKRIKKQNRSNIILTGIPRSGTSLTCKLLNKLANTVALVEPKPPKSLFNLGTNNLQQRQEHQRICQELESWIETMRASLLTSKKVETRLINGQIPDNFASSYFSNTGKRLEKVCEIGELVIDKKLESDFKLCIKHNLWLTAIINKITSNFTTFGIIRNPLSVLASWNTVPFPVTDGHEPIAEQLNSQLAQELQGIDDKFERQIHLLFWCYKQFFSYLPDKNILRYEDLISSSGKSLQVIVPQASLLNESLTSKNNNPIYDKELITFLGHKLLEKEGYVWEFYSKQDVKNIINTSVFFDSSIETTKNNTAILKQNSDFLVPFEETIEACQEIISLQQNNYHAYFLLGNAQSNEGKNDEAISSYKKAIELNPDNPGYYNILGNTQARLKNYEAAIACYQSSLELNPQQFKIYISLGNTFSKIKKRKKALLVYEEALKLEPNNPTIARKLKRLRARKSVIENQTVGNSVTR